MSCDHCHKGLEGFKAGIRMRWCWLSLDEPFTHMVSNVYFLCTANHPGYSAMKIME